MLNTGTANFLAIDFETANYYRDSACAVGLVRVENGRIVHQVAHLIRPPYREFMFTSIHGIAWKDVEKSPEFGAIWQEIAPLFDGIDFLAAHNASFDASVLRASCARYEIQVPLTPFACTVKLARNHWNLFPTKLPDVARHLGLQLNHHEALSDALVCAHAVMAARSEGAIPSLTGPSGRPAPKAPKVRKAKDAVSAKIMTLS